jgi:hypothetical protein
MDLKSGDEAIPALALAIQTAKMSQRNLEETLAGLNNITDEMGMIKPNTVIGTLNAVPPCRNKTTKIHLSKLKFKSSPKHGDCVTRRTTGQAGMFLGFINASKTKCAVVWKCACSNCKHNKSSMVSVFGNTGNTMTDTRETAHVGPHVNTTADFDVTDPKNSMDSTDSTMPDTGEAAHVGPHVNTTADSDVTDQKSKGAVTNGNCVRCQSLSRSVHSLPTRVNFANTCVLLALYLCV